MPTLTRLLDSFFHTPEQKSAINNVMSLYHETNRFYHNEDHLDYFCSSLILFKSKIQFPLMLLAALYHDAVYAPLSQDNEEKSAKLWMSESPVFCLNQEEITRISELILSTKDHRPIESSFDSRLFLDADLAVLGSERAVYQEYMNAIRREYFEVDEKDYNQGRSRILENFLKRDRIYLTDEFHAQLDENARLNLSFELEFLKNGTRT